MNYGKTKRQHHKHVVGMMTLLVSLCAIAIQISWAQQQRVAWEDLHAHIQTKLLPPEALANYDCPDEL